MPKQSNDTHQILLCIAIELVLLVILDAVLQFYGVEEESLRVYLAYGIIIFLVGILLLIIYLFVKTPDEKN